MPVRSASLAASLAPYVARAGRRKTVWPSICQCPASAPCQPRPLPGLALVSGEAGGRWRWIMEPGPGAGSRSWIPELDREAGLEDAPPSREREGTRSADQAQPSMPTSGLSLGLLRPSSFIYHGSKLRLSGPWLFSSQPEEPLLLVAAGLLMSCAKQPLATWPWTWSPREHPAGLRLLLATAWAPSWAPPSASPPSSAAPALAPGRETLSGNAPQIARAHALAGHFLSPLASSWPGHRLLLMKAAVRAPWSSIHVLRLDAAHVKRPSSVLSDRSFSCPCHHLCASTASSPTPTPSASSLLLSAASSSPL